jgi:TIR domain-containing protein
MTRIYISYSRRDIDFARKLAGDLEEAGFDVWWDVADLQGGTDWTRVIQAAIESSQYLIVVLSPSSVASEWVRNEYTQALSLRKTIIPIMLQRSSVPFALNTINFLDFTSGEYATSLDSLLSVLGYTVELPAVSTTTQPVTFRKYAIVIGIGIFILLGLLLTFLIPPFLPLSTPSVLATTPGLVMTSTDTPTASPTVSSTVTLTPDETFTPTPTPTLTPSATPRPNWVVEIYEENRNDTAFWIFTSSLSAILAYVVGVGALLVSAWRFGSNVFSRSWLTKLASRPLLVVPGLGRWALFIGYANRLLNQQDVKRASSGYFGLPAIDPTGEGIFDSSGNALQEEIAKSLDNQKLVLILAKGGGGKTTLLARWSFLALTNSLPLSLKDFKPIFVTPPYYDGSLTNAITSVLRERDRVAVDNDIMQAQLESGKFIILVDGVSEIEGDQNKGLHEILRTAQSAYYQHCRFIITTRPELDIPPEISVFHLQPLTSDVVLGLLHLYKLEKEQEYLIRSQLNLFGAKPIEPLLFSMILEQGKTAQVSRTRSLLFGKYFKRLLKMNSDTLWEGWNVILSEFANWFTLQTGNRGVGMIHEKLIDKISGKANNPSSNSLIQRSKDYYGLLIENELDLLEKLKASGIMQRTKRWRFAHDTFEEYFAACYIISYITSNNKCPSLGLWSINEAQTKSFVGVIEFVREMADEEVLKVLLDSNLPSLWQDVLNSKEAH